MGHRGHGVEGERSSGGRGSSSNCVRDECLNENWFLDLTDARRKIGDWKWDYNHVRPHSALGYLTPMEFAQAWAVSDRGKDAPWKSPTADFSTELGNPPEGPGFPLSQRRDDGRV